MQENNNTLNLTNLLPDFSYWQTNTPEGITTWFCFILLIVFMCSIYWFSTKSRQSLKTIKFMLVNLNNVSAGNLLGERENLRNNMAKNENCKALWEEFDESLVEKNNVLYNTIDAAHFFDTHTLARGVTENRLVASVPSILTAIGVLGTFAGLTLGLGGLGAIGGGGTEDLQSGISNMIFAASIAFTTSFWGVLSSVVFNAYEKIWESRIRSAISNVQDKVDYLYPRLTPESMLAEITNHSKSSDETMLGLAEQIGHKMQESMLQMKSDINAGVATALQEVLAPALSKLADSSLDLAQRQGESSEIALEKLIHSFTDTLSEAGKEQAVMMKDSASQLQSSIKQMQTTQLNAEHRAEAQSQNQLNKLSESTHEMLSMFNKSIGSLEQVNHRVLEEANAQMKGLQHQQALENKKQSEVMSQNSQTILENIATFNHINKQNADIGSSTVVQQQSLLASFKMVSDKFETLAITVTDVFSQLHEAAEETKRSNTELSSTNVFLSDTIAKASQENIQVSEQNSMLLSSFKELVDQVDSSRVSAEKIVGDIHESATFGKETFQHLQEHQEGYRQALTQHVEGLTDQLSHTLGKYLDNVSSQTSDRMRAWDSETMKYTESMQGVVSVMQELVDDMDSKRK